MEKPTQLSFQDNALDLTNHMYLAAKEEDSEQSKDVQTAILSLEGKINSLPQREKLTDISDCNGDLGELSDALFHFIHRNGYGTNTELLESLILVDKALLKLTA